MEDVRACVDLYMGLNPFIPSERAQSIRFLENAARRQELVRQIYRQNERVGWFWAKEVTLNYTAERVFSQMHFCMAARGIVAYRGIVLAHEAIEEKARTLGISLLLSQGSHVDETNVFPRILEKHGWERQGYACKKRLAPRE